jgi:hypothetical protein
MQVIADNGGMIGATWADGDLDGDGEVSMSDLDLAFSMYELWKMPGFALNVVS